MARDSQIDLDAVIRDAAKAPLPAAAELMLQSLRQSMFGELPPGPGDRFRVVRPLGKGGMGTVYLAEDQELGGQVAIKWLPEGDVSHLLRFKQEFRAIAELRHPNVVTPYELLEHDGRWCIVMEYVEGGDFLQHVRGTNGPVPILYPDGLDGEPELTVGGFDEPRLREALAQLVAGVCFLHRSGIVHGDLKPTNILVTPAGRVVILDFGLLRRLQTPFGPGPREVAGTRGFMAPEQLRGEPASEATDWYAVGVILFQCLTGRLPDNITADGLSRLVETYSSQGPVASRSDAPG